MAINSTLVGGYNTAQTLLTGIEAMLTLSLALALFFTLADRDSRSSVRAFISDLFVRWGLSGLMLWVLVLVAFGLYELGLQRGLFHFLPFFGIAEYGGFWGVAISGAVALLFFVTALFISALARAPTSTKIIVSNHPYYPYLEEYARYLRQYYGYYHQYPYAYDAPVEGRVREKV